MKKITPLIAIFAVSSLLAEGTDYTWYTGSITQDARYPDDTTKIVQNYATGSEVSALSWAALANWSTNGGGSSASSTPSVSDNATIMFNLEDATTAKVLLSEGTTTLNSLSIINPNYGSGGIIQLTVGASDSSINLDTLYMEGSSEIGGTSSNRLDITANTINIAMGVDGATTGKSIATRIGVWGGITSIDFGTLTISGQTYKTLNFRGISDFEDGTTSSIDILNVNATGTTVCIENNSELDIGTLNINSGGINLKVLSSTVNIDQAVIASGMNLVIDNTESGTLSIGAISASTNSFLSIRNASELTLTGTGTYEGIITGGYGSVASGKIIIASGADQTFTGYTYFTYGGASTENADLSYVINAGGKLTINYANDQYGTNNLVKIENSGTLVAGGSSVAMGDLLLFGGSTLELNIENVVENEAVFEIYGTLELSLDNNNVSILITGTSDLEQFILFSAENDDLSDIDLTAFIVSNGELSYDLESNTIIFTSTIPEPSTYALIFGVLALGFTYYRRRK